MVENAQTAQSGQFAAAQVFEAVFSQCAVLFMEHGSSIQDTEAVGGSSVSV